MTNGQLMDVLVSRAKLYLGNDPVGSLIRNQHMHKYRGPDPDPELVKAIVVDFVNAFIGMSGGDLGLYTKDV